MEEAPQDARAAEIAVETDKARRTREGHLRANAEYQKIPTLVFSLSTAVIGIPLFFFKDIFGINLSPGESLLSVMVDQKNVLFLTTLVGAIAFLGFSMKCTIDYIEHSGYFVRRVLQINQISDLRKVEDETIEKLNKFMNRSIIYFCIGFALMMAAIVLFVR